MPTTAGHVADVVKKATQILNTLCSFVCEGKGRSEYDMLGRVLRFSFMVTTEENPHNLIPRTADVWISHVRLEKPQAQIFMPLREFRAGEWRLMFRSNEGYSNTN